MSDARVREGMEHLQTAALEMIAAIRTFLEVAEQLVREGPRSPRPPGEGDTDDPGVERIKVL